MHPRAKGFFTAWVLRGPKGALIKDTLSLSRAECWDCAYSILIVRLGASWGRQYWRRLRPSQESAKRHGYRIVRVKIVKA